MFSTAVTRPPRLSSTQTTRLNGTPPASRTDRSSQTRPNGHNVAVDTGIGEILREARNRRKLDLPAVESAIKIRMRYLLAMENEEWDVLPGGAYTRGFIRTYASYLGLDGERLAQDFRNAADGDRAARAEAIIPARTGAGRRLATRRVGAVLLTGALLAVMLFIGLWGGDSSGPVTPAPPQRGVPAAQTAPARAQEPAPARVALHLSATAEVWVCLLGGDGTPLIDGQILEAGAEEGPFRSRRFTLSLGNGAVALAVNHSAVTIPETGSPIGYRIGPDGRISPLGEAERPTCT